MEHEGFTKYEEQGAYHWRNAYERGILRCSPRLHARYDIPIGMVAQHVCLQGSYGADLGCGDGVMLYKIAEKGGSVVGVDKSEEGLGLARRKLAERGAGDHVETVCASCYEVPMENESLDYAVATELIEHLEDVSEFLNEVRRLLRPGGVFVCTTPNRREGQAHDEVRDPFHVHEFDPQELEDCLYAQFAEVSVRGGYPRWLDRACVQGVGPSPVAKSVRVVIRALSRLWNPYEHLLSSNPSFDHSLLVGLARK